MQTVLSAKILPYYDALTISYRVWPQKLLSNL